MSSASAFNLAASKILSFGKELNILGMVGFVLETTTATRETTEMMKMALAVMMIILDKDNFFLHNLIFFRMQKSTNILQITGRICVWRYLIAVFCLVELKTVISVAVGVFK